MNLSRIVERWAAFQPERTAVHFRGRDLSCAELPELSLLSLEGAREGWLDWNALPRNAMGKVQKFELRRALAARSMQGIS